MKHVVEYHGSSGAAHQYVYSPCVVSQAPTPVDFNLGYLIWSVASYLSEWTSNGVACIWYHYVLHSREFSSVNAGMRQCS